MRCKRISPTAPIAALAALVVSLGAGCGSSGEQAEATLTKAQFRQRADKICNLASTEQFKLGGEYLNTHKGADEADAVRPGLLPPLEKQQSELQELPLPAGYEAQIESFLKALDEALEAGKKDPPSLLSKRNNPFEKADELGKRYGLGDCAVNP
jgi:hypothetical protein